MDFGKLDFIIQNIGNEVSITYIEIARMGTYVPPEF